MPTAPLKPLYIFHSVLVLGKLLRMIRQTSSRKLNRPALFWRVPIENLLGTCPEEVHRWNEVY